SKPGYYEKSFCRDGNLGMAYTKPRAERDHHFVGIVYPGHPYSVDFVMCRAAKLHGRLVDATGKLLAKYRLTLVGKTYPASNVLAATKTDAEGRFACEEVPIEESRVAIGHGRAEIRSEPLRFTKPGIYDVDLTYRALDAALDWKIRSRP